MGESRAGYGPVDRSGNGGSPAAVGPAVGHTRRRAEHASTRRGGGSGRAGRSDGRRLGASPAATDSGGVHLPGPSSQAVGGPAGPSGVAPGGGTGRNAAATARGTAGRYPGSSGRPRPAVGGERHPELGPGGGGTSLGAGVSRVG